MTKQTAPTAKTTDPWLAKYPSTVDYHTAFEAIPLYDLFDRSVAKYPNQPCLDFLGKTFTYAEVGDMVNRAAKGFQDLGIGKGGKVGLFLPNCPQCVVAYYGVLKAGGTVVNFSPLYSEPELLHQIEDSHTDIMVTLGLEVLYPKMRTMLAESRLKKLIVGTMQEVLPFPKNLLFPLFKGKDISKVPNDDAHMSFKTLLANDGAYAPVEIDPHEDIAVLQYTGGTTGVSKGAMLTHANLAINAQQIRVWFTTCEDGVERMMGVLPFFHVFAMTIVMNMSLMAGAEIIAHPRFELDDVMNDINKKKPTIMPGVPTMYSALAGHPKIGDYDLSSIKACLSGGAPLPVDVKERFEKLANCVLFEGYGLTESSPVATANPIDGENKAGSIGLPVPGTRIVITDPEDPTKILPQGESGEICIEGPQVMKGYFNRPEATAETLRDGRLHTGDVGYLDEDGYTFIIDRIKDLILSGGYNVYPRHVEDAIYLHPAVEEVTVIGIPDDYRGESAKAFIKLKDGEGTLTEEEMIAFLKDKLGKHELPREVEFRAELPKTNVGKLSKKELVAEEREKYEANKAAKA
ncbi:MAG: long-chain fatty acid--CoA ligase [bacterium]|nr:long-chain fatty acid--CoA ligase [bacterium]